MSDTYEDMIGARNLLDVAYKMLARIEMDTLANEYVDKAYFEATDAIYRARAHLQDAIQLQGELE